MTIMITGANRGVGLALAEMAAAHSQEIIGTYRGENRPTIAGIDWQSLEVVEPHSHHALAKRLAGKPLSLLVCNAGVYLDRGQALDTGYAKPLWDDTFAVNVTGAFLTIQALLPNIRAGKGKIAIISSQMASDTRAPGQSYIYRASKAAVLNLGRNLSSDLRAEGIPVGIYHPGWVQTEMGGSGADITVTESAAGLMARFEALNIATTGCFETWDGRAHPY
jgi:NAD(P)-dependent dehydrogenase (short-subunit alcohol dehydrogenase family)